MELASLIQFGLPISLALIMLSMGLKLHLTDFLRVLGTPRALLLGLSAQMLFVPLLALMLLQIFHLPPLLAIGLMVLSFSPGGTTSNLFSYMAKGDVALSVALTACASVITPFTIPLLTEAVLQMQLGDFREVSIPVMLTMKRLFLVTALPLILGMLWNQALPGASSRIHPLLHRFSAMLFLLVIVAIIIQQWSHLPTFLADVGLVSLLMVIIAMSAGYLFSRMVGLNYRQQKTIAIEVGMQNGGMALIVTQGVLHNSTMSIVPVIYGLLMLVPVIGVVILSRSGILEKA